MTYDTVFLFDVDNTLLDNDRVQADLDVHIRVEYGATARNRYWEIFEAAHVDGATDLFILWRIVLPLSLAPLLTLVVVNALYVWNDLLIAIIFLQDDSKRTLMAGISVFQGRYENQIPLTMAGMVIASAPMIILYIVFQKYFIRGLMAGAVK